VPVDEQQPRQEPKLRNGIVRRVHSLETFLARDTHADVSCLDHAHVVGAISDRERHYAEAVFDQSDHLRFLAGRNTASDHSLAACGELDEERAVPGAFFVQCLYQNELAPH
jgi:hypothetical protein